mgnify:CR=1 FL=1
MESMDGPGPRNEDAGRAGLCQMLGRATGMRLAGILPSGRVLFDSNSKPEELEGQLERPEVRSALDGKLGSGSPVLASVGAGPLGGRGPVAVSATSLTVVGVVMPGALAAVPFFAFPASRLRVASSTARRRFF